MKIIKPWFLNKLEYELASKGWLLSEKNALEYDDDLLEGVYDVPFAVVKETEKAVQIAILVFSDLSHSDMPQDYDRLVWVPKSCFCDSEEAIKELHEKKEKLENNKVKYEKLVAYCKENNIKGARNGFSHITLLKKIKEQTGVEYAY